MTIGDKDMSGPADAIIEFRPKTALFERPSKRKISGGEMRISLATPEKRSRRNLVIIYVALIGVILAVYMQVGNHEFISYDDGDYVTNNPHVAGGITGKNIVWAFTSFEAANWHPITWLSHMADVELYGMNPRGHHLTNVAVHTLTTLLLLLLFFLLTGALWQSTFVAALFALHPLHVESVAWVAERKDVLSAFFWFLTLLFYANFVAKKNPAAYVLSLGSFVLGLMSKPMLVTLPLIMLLMDYWPLDRYRPGQFHGGGDGRASSLIPLLKEKIPFFACSLLSGMVTIHAQQGAMSGLSRVPFSGRVENALVAYVQYIQKAFWPRDLAILYPLPHSFPLWQVVGSTVILLLVSAAVIIGGRRYRYLPVGWFWFLITLVPVIGLIQVGSQSMADRYSYIPLTGLLAMTAWGASDLTRGLRHRQWLLALLAGATVIASTVVTWQQLGYWRDSIALYRHALQVTSDNTYIHNNLGLALTAQGAYGEAIQEFQEALRIYPDYAEAHYNLGNVFNKKGDLDAAMEKYRDALRINPDVSNAHNNLGIILAKKGNLDAAIQEFREALRINPGNAKAQQSLNLALSLKRKQEDARK